MNRRFVLRSVAFTMLASAAIHLAVALAHALGARSLDSVNMFNVLGISLIFPALGSGTNNALASFAAITALWAAVSLVIKRNTVQNTIRRIRYTQSHETGGR